MSTNREDLHRLTDELPEHVAGVVLQFARAALAKDAEGAAYLDADADTEGDLDGLLKGQSGEEMVDQVLADPSLRAKFFASLERTQAKIDAGDWTDGETFMAQMLEKSRRRLAGE